MSSVTLFAGMVEFKPLPCPVCSRAMEFSGSAPKTGPLPELCIFRCMACGHIDTIEDDSQSE
jgi:hypothetical protein